MKLISRLTFILLPFVCSVAWSAATPLRLPAVISAHAMLQAGKPVAIWGWSEPKATVTVEFKASDGTPRKFTAIAGDDGRWSGQLPAAEAGTTGELAFQTGGEHLIIADVLVGEVWLCSGQSNMSYLLNTKGGTPNERTPPELVAAAAAEATAAKGSLRYFAVRGKFTDTPLDDVDGKWFVANAETVGNCFALSWNFAVALREKLNVPVGVIDSAIGGTAIEPWTPIPDLEACVVGPANLARYKQRLDNVKPESKAKFEAAMAEWTQKNPTPELQRQNLASKPVLEGGNANLFPGRLYNGMIHGLEPYTLRGFTWFQGDGNLGNSNEYSVLVQNLITSWRRRWHDETLPFYYVEMQNYGKPQEKPVEPNGLSSIRDAQQGALKLPATDVATAVDVGIDKPNYEAHFPNKKPLGQRLAGLALSHVYGQPGLVNSPALKSFAVEGDKIRLKFEHADGLRLRGTELKGFAIRGAEGDWAWAQGRIDGEDILVWNEKIPAPTDVRYAWAAHPLVSVENRAGLPLRPFRSDTQSLK